MYFLLELFAEFSRSVKHYEATYPRRFHALCIALVASVLLVGLQFTFATLAWWRTPSMRSLVQEALTSASAEERLRATQRLISLYPTVPGAFRTLTANSKDTDVVSLATSHLAHRRDYSSMELLFGMLQHDDPAIRRIAAHAANRLLGRDYRLPTTASGDEQRVLLDRMMQDWAQLKQSSLFRDNAKRLHYEFPAE